MSCFSGSEIINDSLVFCLDVTNSKSYPGSGTTWYDLTANRTACTLLNGVTYSNSSIKSFSFDGIDDYVDCGNSYDNLFSQGITVCSWINVPNYSVTQRFAVFQKGLYRSIGS